MDYYGKRMATCSSDRTVRIHDVQGDSHRLVQVLTGHEGPVWQVAWSHPKFFSLLATSSYDGKVLIWKEENGTWTRVYEHAHHTASVNSIAWSPHELGLNLACGSSDGKISILTYQGSIGNSYRRFCCGNFVILKDSGRWLLSADFVAHQMGCNAVSWMSSAIPESLINASGTVANTIRALASGGCDNLVKIWRCSADKIWDNEPEFILEGHSDWVRDVSFAPNIGLPGETLASCSQDKTVLIWTRESRESQWKKVLLKKFNDALWRVSWSIAGNLLAVSCGDNKVSLWRQDLKGNWECVSEMEETSAASAVPSQQPHAQKSQ